MKRTKTWRQKLKLYNSEIQTTETCQTIEDETEFETCKTTDEETGFRNAEHVDSSTQIVCLHFGHLVML
ncbi:hypothetical protein CHS0354_041945, partial [Potamilus streckersoni]